MAIDAIGNSIEVDQQKKALWAQLCQLRDQALVIAPGMGARNWKNYGDSTLAEECSMEVTGLSAVADAGEVASNMQQHFNKCSYQGVDMAALKKIEDDISALQAQYEDLADPKNAMSDQQLNAILVPEPHHSKQPLRCGMMV